MTETDQSAFKEHRAKAVLAMKHLIEWAQYVEKRLGQSETEGIDFILISALNERHNAFVYEAGMTNGAMMAQYDQPITTAHESAGRG